MHATIDKLLDSHLWICLYILVKAILQQQRIDGVIFCAVCVISKERMLFTLPRTSCLNLKLAGQVGTVFIWCYKPIHVQSYGPYCQPSSVWYLCKFQTWMKRCSPLSKCIFQMHSLCCITSLALMFSCRYKSIAASLIFLYIPHCWLRHPSAIYNWSY
jgi:hypothetical protein